jgi:hypothetical protein
MNYRNITAPRAPGSSSQTGDIGTGGFAKADEGIRTLDLRHGKATL